MKIKVLLIACFVSCSLIARGQDDVSVKAQKMAADLASKGWKTHAGDPSLYEQVFEACAFDAWNESDDPMNTTYVGVGPDEEFCVLQMLNTYAKRDIRDWYPEFENAVRNYHPGLQSIQIAGKLIYPEAEYQIYYTEYCENGVIVEMDKKTLKEEYKSSPMAFRQSLQSFIHPIAKFYRNANGHREEMVIATFTDEFLANRRVPVPVFDGYKIIESDEQPDDDLNLVAEVKKETNLHYRVASRETTTISRMTGKDPEYTSLVYYTGILKESRVIILAEAAFLVEE